MSQGPLAGVRVVELASLGPGPFGVMLLADLGADVIRVDRPSTVTGDPGYFTYQIPVSRGRRSVAVDLKRHEGVELVLRLVEECDVLVEGNRPGVVERLGIGPDVCCAHNERLVYARVTGWGQDGPSSNRAGHDINYLAVSGALHAMGPADRPPAVPLNLLGDFAGGGLYLALGVLAALHERTSSGRGQVIDVAMLDGVASLTALYQGLVDEDGWAPERESNIMDGGAPYYRCYETADGMYVAVGAAEHRFYATLLTALGLDPDEWPQFDRERWPRLREVMASIFATQTRDAWLAHFDDLDACLDPVLTFTEAPHHGHSAARAIFLDRDGTFEPAPAPRFSRSRLAVPAIAPEFGADTDDILRELSMDDHTIARFRAHGVVA